MERANFLKAWFIDTFMIIITVVFLSLFLVSQTALASGKIVFSKFLGDYSQIFMTDENGENQINLSENKVNDGNSVWSPDGKYIAFISDKNQNEARKYEIYIMDADGSHRRRITNDQSFDSYMPSFSPDGRRLAFARTALQNVNSSYRIFITNVNGGQNDKFVTDGYMPNWSPDGTKIAFCKKANLSSYLDICVIDSDGQNLVNITNSPNSVDAYPIWSPDGKQIVFTSNAPLGGFSQIFNLYRMDANGGNVMRLTDGNEEYDSRTWLPNGQYILFEIWNVFDNTHKIAMIKTDGSDLRIICDGSNPSWFDPDFSKQITLSGKLADTWGGIKIK
mgnify:CR=1 FL=1